ncbi:pyridoxamine 5'-phosphate oxidase family protein [Muriicola soli]|uniref:Pyridoxamine 5'-phosphate oxidase family protein n=1 Tax=Muriicola soli TaxID=2507538 RepID=A0A411E7L7_9FLAO|nr:pyridoxamine 5'-phosphate oxidase family protein [Muriicola soli]QBA63597.1 pyridoxamine 5'-phosphate oxidase family protein [Muriicola soli]
MGRTFQKIGQRHREFIEKQKVFFVASAMDEGHINLSPKGMDSLRVLSEKKVIWLNLTGSGNETATHIVRNPRITLMFCAFEGPPQILRLYGQAKVYHPHDVEFSTLYSNFEEIPGSRQVFEVNVDLVQTSCGMGVPLLEYQGERDDLVAWADNLGEEGLAEYKKKKNTKSLEGLSTGIFGK